MRSNAPEFLANVCAEVVDEHPGYFVMLRLFRDFMMPGLVEAVSRDAGFMKMVKDVDRPGPATRPAGSGHSWFPG